MKCVKHINFDNPQLIDQATRRVLSNHTKRRKLWDRLSEGNRAVKENIERYAKAWSEATGKPVTYEQARKQLFRRIGSRTEREQLREMLAHDESKTAEQNIAQFVEWVRKRIAVRDWVPDGYREFYINDGIRKKRRKIAATTVISQVFHWVLIMAISPVIMRGMVAHTCASIPKRGAHYGKRFIAKWLQDGQNTKYCAKIDISKFYQSINQEAAKQEFRRYIADKMALWLIDTIIDSYPEGLPIGTYTSQWFANWILQRLDHFIKETLRVKYAMRYMDDIVMFGRNKKELHKVMEAISGYLEPFGLHLKGNWQVFRVDHVAKEYGIVIDKYKRTDNLTVAVELITNDLRRLNIPYKVIYRRKHKDTKARKRTHKEQEQYKQILIKIPPAYIEHGAPAQPYIAKICEQVRQLCPNLKRIEYGMISRRAGRDIDFMGFRFYQDHITIRRNNSLRIRRLYAKAAKMGKVDPHTAAGCLSYLGWTKNTDSYNFTVKYIDNVKPIRELKEVVRNETKNSRKAGGGAHRTECAGGVRGSGNSNQYCRVTGYA